MHVVGTKLSGPYKHFHFHCGTLWVFFVVFFTFPPRFRSLICDWIECSFGTELRCNTESILFRISELYSLYLSIVFCWHSYQAVCGLESSRDPLYFHPNILHMKAEQREMFVLQNHFMAQITPCSESSWASILTHNVEIQSIMLAVKLKTKSCY